MPEVDLLRAEVFRLAGMLDQQKLENARLRKVVEAAIKCHKTFRTNILLNSPYPEEAANNIAFDKAVREYLKEYDGGVK